MAKSPRSRPTPRRTSAGPQLVTRSDVEEIVEDLIRKAISAQARDLEKHLSDINTRLQQLETRGR